MDEDGNVYLVEAGDDDDDEDYDADDYENGEEHHMMD